jgi:hypothetical protein
MCVQGIGEWLTGLLGLSAQAGDRSPARMILGLWWGPVGSERWKASRFTGEATREAGTTWTRLERAGRGGRGLGSGGGVCSRRSPVNFDLGKAWERARRYDRGLGLLIGTARARGGLDWTMGRARARVGRTPACRPGSNKCARSFCLSSGACGHSSELALALVSAQNLFSSL